MSPGELHYKHIAGLLPEFARHFGAAPALAARAPGRVNLIGEHTDYNGGWVLPVAISFEVNVVAAPRDDGRVRLLALDLQREATFHLSDRQQPKDLWQRYPQGVAITLQQDGQTLKGLDAVYRGDVPAGAGLSSSAAVEVAFARAFATAAGLTLSGVDLALASQRAENEFVGVASGIMDQFISALGREGQALLLNCASLEYRYVPINLPNVAIVVMDTGVRRELANSEYGRRRAECEAALRRLQAPLPELQWLCDCSPETLEEHRNLLDEVQLRRARHVIQESRRTVEAAEALVTGDVRRLGALMRVSHESLRDLYEVSSAELDALVEIAWGIDGVIGARMTGAGFGGAAVALVDHNAVEALQQAVAAHYPARTGRQATLHVCRSAQGAEATWLKATS